MKHASFFAKKVIGLIVCSSIFGCAVDQGAQIYDTAARYTAENRPKVLAGTLSWTEYYSRILALAESLPPNHPNRSREVSRWLEALGMAREYEAGRISKEAFYKWREDENRADAAKNEVDRKNRAVCEYEAKSAAAGVIDRGRSGINFDQIFKERELFELCMKSRQ